LLEQWANVQGDSITPAQSLKRSDPDNKRNGRADVENINRIRPPDTAMPYNTEAAMWKKLYSNPGLVLLAILATGIWFSNVRSFFQAKLAPKICRHGPDAE
jgi:hypothetical protein